MGAKINKYDILMFFLGISLNQSFIIFGINTSFADVLLVILLAWKLLKYDEFMLPAKEVLFFILLSIFLILVPLVIIPMVLDVNIPEYRIIVNYLKYIVVLLYFLVGYNLSYEKHIKSLLAGFVISSLVVSILGIIGYFLNVVPLMDAMFLGNSRLQGFMSDPNYFAVLQLISLGIVLSANLKLGHKFIFGSVLFFSIVLSGSKTGIISTILIAFISVLVKTNNPKSILKLLMWGTIAIFIWIVLPSNTFEFITTTNISSLNRVMTLFENFQESLVGNGSGRIGAWVTAIEIMKLFPMFGVGAGGYLPVAKQLFEIGVIAHNTYLQLLVEWGIPLTIIFFGYVMMNIFISMKDWYGNYKYRKTMVIILIIFLLGSLSISLNNARFFWIALGCIAAYKNKLIRVNSNLYREVSKSSPWK